MTDNTLPSQSITNQVILGDCLEKMKDIPDNHVDLILTDPPYNIKKDSWDKIDDYQNWCKSWMLECQRVLKDNGSFYFFHNDMPTISKLMSMIEEETKFIFKQMIIWTKYFKGGRDEGYCKYRLSNDINRNFYSGFTEYCLFYTFQDETGLTTVMLDVNNFPTLRRYFRDLFNYLGKTKKQLIEKIGQNIDHSFRFSSSQWDLPTKETYQQLIDIFQINQFSGFREYESLRMEYESLRMEYESLRYTFNNQHVMTDDFYNQNWNNNVWFYPIDKKIGHVTPKPVKLIENILLHSSNENYIILDPFAGSGTTAIACLNTNRKYICIEKEPKYFDIINKRIAEHNSQSNLLQYNSPQG